MKFVQSPFIFQHTDGLMGERHPGPPGSVLPPDPQMRAVIGLFHEHLGAPFREFGVAELRRRSAAVRPVAPPSIELAEVTNLEIPGRSGPISARKYRPQCGPASSAIVYFHGGGWVLGGLEEYDGFCRMLAGLTGSEIVSVAYRLAPEHVYPAAVHDAEDATRWLADASGDVPLVVMGDNAGGTLAAVVARRARDHGTPAITLQILVYPLLDHRMTSASYRERGNKMLICADDMAFFWSQYLPGPADTADPDASPGLAEDLRGLPPALVVVAEFDPVRDECLTYARRLEESGVRTTVYNFNTMAHGFFPMLGAVGAADDAIRSVALAISDVWQEVVCRSTQRTVLD